MRAEATKRAGEERDGLYQKSSSPDLRSRILSPLAPSERNWPDTVSPTVRTHGGTAKHPWSSFRPGGPDGCRCRQTPSTLRTADPEPLGPGLHHLRHQPLLGARRLCGNRAHGESHPRAHLPLCMRKPHPTAGSMRAEKPQHEVPRPSQGTLAQRKKARDRIILMRFIALSPKADRCYRQLAERRM